MASIFSKILYYIMHPRKAVENIMLKDYLSRGDYKAAAGMLYRRAFGRNINWDEPEDLNQWINRIEFTTDTTEWSRIADKYRMRDYVTERGYKDHLVKLLAVWKNPEDISFAGLPDKFVLKANNGCGDVRIITDKSAVNLDEIKEYFKGLFANRFGINSAEPHYTRIEPVVIAEEMLDRSRQDGESTSLIDYKFWCFNGKPVICFVCSNRTKHYFTTDIYTAKEWKRVDDEYGVHDGHHILKAEKAMPKPSELDKMFEIASALSKGHPQMRVDFYQVDGKVYVGEMTMTSACGRMDYFTKECLDILGDHCRVAFNEIQAGK